MMSISIADERDSLTYEDRLRELGKITTTHEVRVRSDRFKVDATLEFRNEEDAREVARLLVEAAREVHGEKEVRGKYTGDYSGLEKIYSYEDVYYNSLSAVYMQGWSIEVWCLFPKHPYAEIPLSEPEIVVEYRFGANRVARPDSKVFVYCCGTDCDGTFGQGVYEFAGLREAADGVESLYQGADGSMNYSVISRQEYESF